MPTYLEDYNLQIWDDMSQIYIPISLNVFQTWDPQSDLAQQAIDLATPKPDVEPIAKGAFIFATRRSAAPQWRWKHSGMGCQPLPEIMSD